MPITPGSAGASFDVLLAFSMDEEANRRVQAGISTLEAELKRLQGEAKGVGPAYKESGETVKKTSKEVAQELRAQARAMRAEAASLASDIKAVQIGLLRDLSSSIAGISTKALVTGGAIIGGIFAEVQNYVNKAPEATRETREWAAAMETIGRSRSRIDEELLRTTLPLLKDAARISSQIAGFVESHPEITSIALQAGKILVGVGVIGLAVSKGIKLVADIQYLTTIPTQLAAAKLQDLAADKQLAAARIQLKDIPGAGGGGGGAGRALGNIGLIGGFLALSASVVLGTSKALDGLAERLVEMGGVAKGVGQGIQVANHGLLPLIKNTLGFGQATAGVAKEVSLATGLIRGSANEAAIVEAFSSWKEDDARLIREAADNRARIIAEGERQIADITREYANERVDINRRFNSNRANITRSFEQEDLRAAEDHQRSRAEEIARGNDRIRELEESHQERLREIRERAAESIEAATFSRDALALVRAQRQLTEDEQEENRSFRQEAARARRETAQRLQELDSQYAIERDRRRQQFEQDLADNEAQRVEELRRAAEAFQAERAQAQASQAQKLRDLQEGLNAERIRRREVFLAQIRDLDASLLGEQALRQKKYQDMLRDAEAFLNQYRATLPTASSPFSGVTGSAGGTVRDKGGYMGRGLYQNLSGVPEFALSGSTTKAAERAIGANLTDESLSRLFGRLGDMRSAVYNDNRRMDAPLSKDARRMYEETARAALQKALGVA